MMMRTGFVVVAACALVVGLTSMAFAFTGETLYVPEVDPTAIVLDGLDTEWSNPDFYDPAYILTRDDLRNVTGGDLPPIDDWDGVLWTGWSAPPDNMMYGFYRMSDDILNDESATNGPAWRDDTLELFTDADAGGGDYNAVPPRGTIAQQWCIRITMDPLPPGPGGNNENTQWFMWADMDRAWASGPPWMEAALIHPTTRENYTATVEWKLALWDVLGDDPETSVRHINELGDIIGFAYQMDDSDAEIDTRDDQPGTPGAGDAWHIADSFNETIFVEGKVPFVAVEPVSWGAIKATFK